MAAAGVSGSVCQAVPDLAPTPYLTLLLGLARAPVSRGVKLSIGAGTEWGLGGCENDNFVKLLGHFFRSRKFCPCQAVPKVMREVRMVVSKCQNPLEPDHELLRPFRPFFVQAAGF